MWIRFVLIKTWDFVAKPDIKIQYEDLHSPDKKGMISPSVPYFIKDIWRWITHTIPKPGNQTWPYGPLLIFPFQTKNNRWESLDNMKFYSISSVYTFYHKSEHTWL